MSLADFVTMALMAFSTAMVEPGRSPSLVGDWLAACRETVSGVSRLISPLVELLEQEKEGHHLGDRGGVAKLILTVGIERPTGVHVDHHGGESW